MIPWPWSDVLRLPPIMCDRCHKPAPLGVKHRCPRGKRR